MGKAPDNQVLHGVYMVLLTPYDSDGNQDSKGLEKIVDFYISSGIDGITALGEVSEVDKLTESEREENIKHVINKVDGRVPVVIGASRQSTRQAVEAAQWAEEKGATAIMVAPPKNLKMTSVEMLHYFKEVGKNVSLPLIIQDEPETGHPYMPVDLILRISKEVPNAKYVKLEDQPSPLKMEHLCEFPGMPHIFSASHGRDLFWALERGVVGVMTSSPLPEFLVGIWNSYKHGEIEKARELFYINLPLMHYFPEMILKVKKEVLKQRGLIEYTKVRENETDLSRKSIADLVDMLNWTMEKSRQIQTEGFERRNPGN
ncbi:MAG: dihydrodipicolinate synthase family protein [Nitrososphaerota archaeon]|nr:dihydrodipicolinate synthase family protein [Nitrososphaerota archaeon]